MKQSNLYLTLLNFVMCFVNVKGVTLHGECYSEDGKNDYQIDLVANPVPPNWVASVVYGSSTYDDGFFDSFNVVEGLKFEDWGDAPEVYISECPSGFTTKFGNDVDDLNAYCYKKINDKERNNELTVVYKKINNDDKCIDGFEELASKDNDEKENTEVENNDDEKEKTEVEKEISEEEDSEEEKEPETKDVPEESEKESEDESDDKKLPMKSSSTEHPWKCGKEYGKCKEGYCCSKYGWCGKTSAYCDNGCQSEFGICHESTTKHPWKCGKENGKCKEGYCCSKYGWCGKTAKYCDKQAGCQSEFGICW